MISPAIDYFAANLPYRPYHANELLYGLRIDKAAKAVLARYIQHNPPHAMYWLVFDVDRPVGMILMRPHLILRSKIRLMVMHTCFMG